MSSESPLNIVIFAAEAFPYAKVGGLAAVAGVVPKFLEQLGAKLTVVIPAYKDTRHDKFGIRPYEAVLGFDVPMGPGFAHAEIFHTQMEGTSIDVFLIGSVDYFYREGIYDDPVTKTAFSDNMERYVFFMKAGLELLLKIDRPVDIIHCHDWQTALIPGLLATGYQCPFFARTGTLFTIHNLAYQGLYPKETLYWAGIDYRYFYPTSPFEFWGKVNFLKVGIEHADLINTVSATYAAEIQSSPEYGCGLEGVLRSRKDDLFGIVNGIDYEEWNPETDPALPAPYSAQDLSGKAVCKAETLNRFGLPRSSERVPLIGIVSRLADQKGFDLIAEVIDEIAALDLQMVVLGTGRREHQQLVEQLSTRFPEKVGVMFAFDPDLAHLIIAGSDMILMPSRYEPCGLNQLEGQRYGTVPIVRATGGLADTVVNYDLETDTGTGFSFPDCSAQDMLTAIKRALIVYSDPLRWQELITRDMSQDWSWKGPADKYMSLYRKIWQKKNPKPVETPQE